MTASRAMVYSSGPAATSTRASIKKMNAMAMGKCTGPMEAATKVNGSKVSSTVTGK